MRCAVLVATLAAGCGPAATGGVSSPDGVPEGGEIHELGATGFSLDVGVVVAHDHTIFAMAPLDRIAAIAPATGEVLWESSAGALPLYVAGDLLLAQAVNERTPGLHLVVIDVATGEEVALCDPIRLPAWVRPAIDEERNYGFSVTAEAAGGRVFVGWDANAWDDGDDGAERHTAGAAEIVDLNECDAVERDAPVGVDGDDGGAIRGYASADGETRLVMVEDAGRIVWQLFDGEEQIAEVPGEDEGPPFFVHDDVLITASRVEVSGRSLDGGRVIWYYPIRMTIFAGPG